MANDNEPQDSAELIDRLRAAALGKRRAEENAQSAQLAFDPEVALETRLRIIAQLSERETLNSQRSFSLRGALIWLPISLGVAAVMALGAMLTRSVSEKPKPALAPQIQIQAASQTSAPESETQPAKSRQATQR